MQINKQKTEQGVQVQLLIFWGDLSRDAQDRLLKLWGDNGNTDLIPLAEMNDQEETK